MTIRAEVQQPGGRHQPDHRQHQRQTGRDERPEREQQDRRASPASEITSDFSIAERFAALKSDHIPEAPVRCTCTPAVDSAGERALELVGGLDHRVRVTRRAGLDDRGVSVREIDTPAAGVTTRAARRVGAQRALDASRARS